MGRTVVLFQDKQTLAGGFLLLMNDLTKLFLSTLCTLHLRMVLDYGLCFALSSLCTLVWRVLWLNGLILVYMWSSANGVLMWPLLMGLESIPE